MNRTIKAEIHRAFINYKYAVSLGIGLLIISGHIVVDVAAKQELLILVMGRAGAYPTCSVYNSWIGMDAASFFSTTYFLVFPLIVAFPFVDSYFSDLHTGYIRSIVLQSSQAEYLTGKFVANFLCAGTIFTIPLIINILLTSTMLPLSAPQAGSFAFQLADFSMWSRLYYSYPSFYTIGYILLDFFYVGLLASSVVTFAPFSEKKYENNLLLCLVYLSSYYVCLWLGVPEISPYGIVNPAQLVPGVNFWLVLSEILIMAFYIFCFIKVRKGKDVL